jgi:hypothetical protein
MRWLVSFCRNVTPKPTAKSFWTTSSVWSTKRLLRSPPAPAGKDVDQAAVEATIVDEVRKAVAALPAPKDGHSPSVEEYGPIIAETVQRAVAAIPAAKDGVNLAGALIDRDGNLILTLSNGQTCPLGRVVGKDGVDADMVALERRAGEMIAALPKPRDGKDGVDGIGFDDMTCEIRDDGVFLVWDKGDLVKEARLPIPIDRGVFKEGQDLPAGRWRDLGRFVLDCTGGDRGQTGHRQGLASCREKGPRWQGCCRQGTEAGRPGEGRLRCWMLVSRERFKQALHITTSDDDGPDRCADLRGVTICCPVSERAGRRTAVD